MIKMGSLQCGDHIVIDSTLVYIKDSYFQSHKERRSRHQQMSSKQGHLEDDDGCVDSDQEDHFTSAAEEEDNPQYDARVVTRSARSGTLMPRQGSRPEDGQVDDGFVDKIPGPRLRQSSMRRPSAVEKEIKEGAKALQSPAVNHGMDVVAMIENAQDWELNDYVSSVGRIKGRRASSTVWEATSIGPARRRSSTKDQESLGGVISRLREKLPWTSYHPSRSSLD
jgi:hypothetical protein